MKIDQRNWTSKEERTLARLWASPLTAADIAFLMGRPASQIYHKRRHMGLPRRASGLPTPKRLQDDALPAIVRPCGHSDVNPPPRPIPSPPAGASSRT